MSDFVGNPKGRFSCGKAQIGLLPRNHFSGIALRFIRGKTCVKRPLMGSSKSGLLRQVVSEVIITEKSFLWL